MLLENTHDLHQNCLKFDFTDATSLVGVGINNYSMIKNIIFRKKRSKNGELIPFLRIIRGYKRELVNQWIYHKEFSKNFHYNKILLYSYHCK